MSELQITEDAVLGKVPYSLALLRGPSRRDLAKWLPKAECSATEIQIYMYIYMYIHTYMYHYL